MLHDGEQALWLDFGRCFNTSAAALEDDKENSQTIGWEKNTGRKNAKLKGHLPERISILRDPNGRCTDLPGAGKVWFDLMCRLVTAWLPTIVNVVPPALHGRVVFNLAEQGMSVSVVYDGTDPTGDRFSLKFWAGFGCTHEFMAGTQSEPGYILRDFRNHTHDCSILPQKDAHMLHVFTLETQLSLKAITAASTGAGTHQCYASTMKPQHPLFKLLMPQAGFRAGHGEPQVRLAWSQTENFAPVPPTIECPPRIPLALQQFAKSAASIIGDQVVLTRGAHGMHLRLSARTNGDQFVFITATDTVNVSSITIHDEAVENIGSVLHPLWSFPPNFRRNVTFRATNLLGLSSECKSEVSTFTTKRAWNPDEIKLGGEDTANRKQVLYYVGTPYDVGGPSLNKRELFEAFSGSALNITFELIVAPSTNNLVYIDPETGAFIVKPQEKHGGNSSVLYSATLRGRDVRGAPADVKKFSFVVKPRPAFEVSYEQNRGDGPSLAWKERSANRQVPFAVNAPFSFAPINITHATGVAVKEQGSITFTLVSNCSNTIGGTFFVDPNTGAVQGFVGNDQDCELTLKAVHPSDSRLQTVVEKVQLRFRKKDVEDDANGPNGKGCVNGNPVDNATVTGPAGKLSMHGEFDGNFTCNCSSDYTGQNCDFLQSTVNGGTDSVVVVAVVVLSAIIVLLSTATAAAKQKAHRAAHGPVDFTSRLQELLDSGVLHMAPTITRADSVSAPEAGIQRAPTIARADSVASAALPIVPRELKRSWLTLGDRLGKGSFGDVWKGTLDDGEYKDVPPYLVAAKTVLEGSTSSALAAEEDLLKEAALMAQVGQHINVVSLIGVITAGRPRTLVVSYCENGNLIDWLRQNHADGASATNCVKVQMCCDIAVGMDHLASCHIVHRDLAARNILLANRSGGSNTCKVADFGLSKAMRTGEEYYRLERGQFPVKWTAPEAIKEGRYSTATDIWSFAITAIEMFQDGKMPYSDMSNPEVLAFVEQQQHHSCPPQCTEEVYAVLTMCFRFEPSQRPSFAEVVEHFRRILCADDKAGRQAAHPVHSDRLHGAAPQQQHHNLCSGVYDNGQDNLFSPSADMVGEAGVTATQLPVSTDSVRISPHRPHMAPIELQNADRAPPPGQYAPLHTSTVVTDNAQYVQRGLQRVSPLLATIGNTMPGWEPANIYTVPESTETVYGVGVGVVGEQSRGGMPTRQESITSFGEPTHLEEASVTEASSGLGRGRGRGRGRSSTSPPRSRSSRPAPALPLPRSLVQQTPDAPTTSLTGARACQMRASRGSSGSAEVMLGWEKPRDVITIYEAVGSANVIRSNSADTSMGIDGQISIDAQASISSGGTCARVTPYAEQLHVTEVIRAQQHFGTLASIERQCSIDTQFSMQSGSATVALGSDVALCAVHTHVSDVVRAHRHTAGLVGQTVPVQSTSARYLHGTPAAERTAEENVAAANDRLQSPIYDGPRRPTQMSSLHDVDLHGTPAAERTGTANILVNAIENRVLSSRGTGTDGVAALEWDTVENAVIQQYGSVGGVWRSVSEC